MSLSINKSSDNYQPLYTPHNGKGKAGGFLSLFQQSDTNQKQQYKAINQIYEKHYTGSSEFKIHQAMKDTQSVQLGVQNAFKKIVSKQLASNKLQIELQKYDDDVLIEQNNDGYPKEILEIGSDVNSPMKTFLNFKQQKYDYDFRKNSLQKQMFTHIKDKLLPDIDTRLLKSIESFENDQIKSWKEDAEPAAEAPIQEDKVEENKDQKVPELTLPTMKNRQDQTSYTLVTIEDKEYAIQTIYDCVKQEHGIAFHEVEVNRFNGKCTLKKIQYFTTKKYQKNKIYTYISDQFVSFKVIKDSVYFFTIGIDGKVDGEENQEESEEDDQNGNEYGEEENQDENKENDQDEDEQNENDDDKKQDNEEEDDEQADEEQAEEEQEEEQEDEEKELKEGGDDEPQLEWLLLLNKFNLKTKQNRIVSEEKHNTENDKDKIFEPVSVLIIDELDAKSSSKQNEKDDVQKLYACIVDVEFKIHPKYHYNYFLAGQITVVSLDYDYDGKNIRKQFFDEMDYLINLWYPIKALKLNSNILKSYNKTKDSKIIEEKLDTIVIYSFSEGLMSFETKQKIQKIMPNVFAAFQLNEKEEEFEKRIVDLKIPEHKEYYKDKKFNQAQLQTHKSFNEILQYACFLNSSGQSWIDRTSNEKINQKITFGRNYNEFFKHLLYNSSKIEKIPYKSDEKSELQYLQGQKYFKNVFDKNEKIYLTENIYRDKIQLLSSSILTNKSNGHITVLLHILQDTREQQTVVQRIKLKNWLINSYQDQFNKDINSFNKFFFECIEKPDYDQVFSNSLLTISRYTNQVCRSYEGISTVNKLYSDYNYNINGFKSTQCIVGYDSSQKAKSIDEAIKHLSEKDKDRVLFIQDQDLIQEIQILGKQNQKILVEDLVFKDKIQRKYLKPQKTIFEDDDRIEIPVIAFNIENSNMFDITFAIIEGNKLITIDKEEKTAENKSLMKKVYSLNVLSELNLQQGQIKMNDNTHQQIGLAQSSEFSEGKRMKDSQIQKYFCQNYQSLVLDSTEKLANIIEVQVKWIPKSKNSYNIETSFVGIKTFIVNEDQLKIEIFPLFQRQNNKAKKGVIDRSHFQINGTQIILEIQREEKDENDEDGSSEGEDSYGGSYSSDGYGSEEDENKKKKMEKKYIFYNLRNPTLDPSEYNFINKFTKSRLRQIDDGLVGLLSEIWFNKELVQMSHQKLFNDDIMFKILNDLNNKTLNSKLLDIHNFMNVSAFLNQVPNNGVITATNLFQRNILKQFEACELYGGVSLIELTDDSKIVIENINQLIKQSKKNKFDFECIQNPLYDEYSLNALESALRFDKDNTRYQSYLKLGLLFGKECIRMNMDYKSIIQLRLERNDLKSAEILIQYLTQEMKDEKNLHSHIMSLMNIIVEKEYFNQNIINVFKDLETDENEDENDKDQSTKQFIIESLIQSTACSTNELPDYMSNILTAFPLEFDRAERDDNYFAGKFKENLKESKKSDEQNGYPVKYTYLNLLDYAIQIRLNKVREACKIKDGDKYEKYLDALNEQFTQYDLSIWVQKILTMSVHEIENTSIIRDLIDYQFQNTKRFYRFNLIIYSIFYVIPLVIQMFQVHSWGVVLCNLSCLITNIYFFMYELIDMRDGLGQYFESIWNWIDTSQFVFYLIYFNVRIYTSEISYIPDKENEDQIKFLVDNKNTQARFLSDIMPLFNFIILFQAFFGLLFYMKIFKKFGELVRLLALCIRQVSTFTVFLLVWVVLLAFLFKILGANFEDDDTHDFDNYNDDMGDYRMMNELSIYFIQTFRNCIGDISTPHYQYWWKLIQAQHEGQNGSIFYFGYFQIYLIWLLWFFEIYMMVIIMLNFLIAIVSQSYESVMSCHLETHYVQKSELTQEYMQAMDYLDTHGYGWLIKVFQYRTENFNYILLASSRDQEGSGHNEWGGLVRTIKKFVSSKNSEIKKSLSNLDQKFESKIDSKINELNSKMIEEFKQLKTFIEETQNSQNE